MKSPDGVEDYNFISGLDFVIAERLQSSCSKEKINAVTFKELDEEDLETIDIEWLGKK